MYVGCTYIIKMGRHISTDFEREKKIRDIKKEEPDFNYSELCAIAVDKHYDELFSDSLEFLRLRYSKLIEEEKELDNKIKITKEKLDKAEAKEAKRIKIEEEIKKKELEKQEKQILSHLPNLLSYFEGLTEEDARKILKKFFRLNEYQKKYVGGVFGLFESYDCKYKEKLPEYVHVDREKIPWNKKKLYDEEEIKQREKIIDILNEDENLNDLNKE